MKRNKFFTLFLTTTLSACTVFSACKNSEPPTTPPATPPTTNPPVEVVYVSVNDVVEEALGNYSFSQEYNTLFNQIASDNVDGFISINSINAVIDQNDYKVTILVETLNGTASYSATGIQGNVTEFLSRGTKTDAQNVADFILELEYLTSDIIIDNSQAETAIKTFVTQKITEFNTVKENISSATFVNDNSTIDPPTVDPEPGVDPEPEPPQEVTYVVAGDVVNQILGDINVEADIQAVAEAVATTSTPAYTITKILALDVDGENNMLSFYTERQSNNTANLTLVKYEINQGATKYKNFYDYIKNKEEVINILTEKKLNTNSQIEENSTLHNDIKNALNSLRSQYFEEMNLLKSTTEPNINLDMLFKPDALSSQEMTNLGIEDMNEFSYALLENTRGNGYDKVTGFESEDILWSYINKAGAPNINGYTTFDIVTGTKTGMHKTSVVVAVQQAEEAYTKLLNNSADAAVVDHVNMQDYLNPIVYNTDGTRVVENQEVASASPFAFNINGEVYVLTDKNGKELSF